MNLPEETDNYIRESIEDTIGLPISTRTLQLKLRASDEARHHLHNQCLHLRSKLKEKDEIIDRARAEASINAQALRKFVDENQKLAEECANLLAQCKRWEKECSLYDGDREALMEFGNEADERAKEAEIRVLKLEEEMGLLSKELEFYKSQYEAESMASSTEVPDREQILIESILTTAVQKDEVAGTALSFLEANRGVEVCQKLLNLSHSLKPFTCKVLALIAAVKTLENDKEHLRINLHRAEEEVNVLFKENNVLDEENKRLLRKLQIEKRTPGSGAKHSSSATKENKRKSSPSMSSPVGRKIDFAEVDSLRQPLSPLNQHSPDPRMNK